ncbi:hypothetical protein EVAR_85004_1 [Eumeta japonica]|uniref:ATP-dependent DNA helicase n=1 Tax=Eumeta variegata TaxID=151549 RepID=A0A4C1WA70_EUMVA|nr:hypothetical protein EVAR_85004_1 [Eumeta japonica]
MAHRKSLEALNRTLQDLRDNPNVMRDVLLILSGDFRETLPAIPKSTPADEIDACLKKSVIWEHVKIVIFGDSCSETASAGRPARGLLGGTAQRIRLINQFVNGCDEARRYQNNKGACAGWRVRDVTLIDRQRGGGRAPHKDGERRRVPAPNARRPRPRRAHVRAKFQDQEQPVTEDLAAMGRQLRPPRTPRRAP